MKRCFTIDGRVAKTKSCLHHLFTFSDADLGDFLFGCGADCRVLLCFRLDSFQFQIPFEIETVPVDSPGGQNSTTPIKPQLFPITFRRIDLSQAAYNQIMHVALQYESLIPTTGVPRDDVRLKFCKQSSLPITVSSFSEIAKK